MSRSRKIGRRCLLVVSICIAFGGCAMGGSEHRSSSVVSYLYPNQNQPGAARADTDPLLPMRIGLAFVPEQGLSHQALTERDKASLKATIADYLQQQSFVRQVTLVPSAYLRPGGSFGNLDQLRKMYDIDIMVLLSYDRAQFVGAEPASITYWTLDGAQLISGASNDTYTLLDAAVYDIAERRLLFRAPGSSLIQPQPDNLTLAEQVRQDSLLGFAQASTDLMSNLRQQLTLFRAQLERSAGHSTTADNPVSHRSAH